MDSDMCVLCVSLFRCKMCTNVTDEKGSPLLEERVHVLAICVLLSLLLCMFLCVGECLCVCVSESALSNTFMTARVCMPVSVCACAHVCVCVCVCVCSGVCSYSS